MKPSHVALLLQHTIAARHAVLLVGPPGVGKTDLCTQAAAAAKAHIRIWHPVVQDPTHYSGLPWPNAQAGSATYLPFEELHYLLNATELTVVVLDDLGQAPAAVQAACMQLLLSRSLNGFKLPDCVVFIACTNRREDRAGVMGILEPVKSRFVTIVHVAADHDDWESWALGTGANLIPPEMIAYHRAHPDMLHQFKATAEIENTPCPRTWANLAKVQALSLPKAVRLEAFAGAVGMGAATHYSAFLDLYASLATADDVIADPHGAPVPSRPGELYAIATALGFRATEANFDRIAVYVERMAADGHGDIAACTLKDAVRRHPELKITPGYIRMARGEVGQILLGSVGQ